MSYKFDEILKKGTQKIKENIDEYKIFLKVMGNNYKYDSLNQINIYFLEPNAKACAEFDFWKERFNRVVRRGQKGIPIYLDDNKKTRYIYDVSQTISLDSEAKKIPLWNFTIDENKDIVEKIENNSLIKNHLDKEAINIFIQNSNITDEDKKQFFIKSAKIAINNRIGLDSDIHFTKKDRIIFDFLKNENQFYDVLNRISNITKNSLKEINKEIKRKNREKLLTGLLSASYTLNEEKEQQKTVNNGFKNNIIEEVEDGRKSDISRQGIYSEGRTLLSSRKRIRVRRNGWSVQIGRYGRWDRSIDSQYRNRISGQEQIEQNGKSEIGLSSREESSQIFGNVGNRRIDTSSIEDTGRSRGNERKDITSNEERVGDNRTIEDRRPNGMGWTDEQLGSNNKGNHSESTNLHLENNQEDNSINDKYIELSLNSYNNIGMQVLYNNKDYKILKNSYVPNGMSSLTLEELEENTIGNTKYSVTKSIFYTELKGVENLLVKENELLKFEKPQQEIKEEENTINYGQPQSLFGTENLKNLTKTQNLSDLETTYSEKKNEQILNYRIKEEILPEKLTPGERLENNINAIKTLINIENENRAATEQEKDILAKYVGWGGLADVFDESKKGQWESSREFLKSNLSDEEYTKARESTLTAFFTPKIVIDNIYKGLDNLGFKEGKILEPSSGIGNFIGSIPEKMGNSKFYSVELDSLSGRIEKALYPQANIQIDGFENTDFKNNFFDIAIGNVPFGDFKVNDKEYDRNNFLIHDYFFAKSIDKVRPGGVIAFITSNGTMDKKDESIRRYIGERCELLGAVRLPNNTFKGVAGTEVTSDIIFLKKREERFVGEEDWYKTSTDSKGLSYNKYFIDNPGMILGNMIEVRGRFGNTITCEPTQDLKDLFPGAIENIKGTYKERDTKEEDINITYYQTQEVRNFSFFRENDKVFFKENNEVEEIKENKEKFFKYIDLANSIRNVIYLQKENSTDEDIKKAQDNLNQVYDDFTRRYGLINSNQNNKLFREDSTYSLLSSAELVDDKGNFIRKSDIFSKRTIKKAMVIDKVENSSEALLLSISQKVKVDFDYMEKLTGKERNILIDELKGQIFANIKNNNLEYVSNDEYLTGNIREKISDIDNYIKYCEENNKELLISKEELEYQKEKLKEVLPKELEASEINVRIGATWIPKEDIKRFVIETLKPPTYLRNSINIEFSEYNSEWRITGKSADRDNPYSIMTYGTERANAYKLIEDALNLRDTRIFDYETDENGKTTAILNKKETMLASQKQDLLREEFKNWVFKEPNRREKLVKIYNEKFNSVRLREFDGSHLTLDGINPEIKLRPHQLNAVARTLYGGNTLLAHVVGAGKTFEMVASAMESKRLGLCNKSLFVVPNHLTEQIGKEFLQLYPGANVLVATKKDFEPANRKRFTGKIATGEYDAIIIGHSQFEKIPMSKEYQKQHITNEINEIIDNIKRLKEENNQNFTVKQLEGTKKKLEARLKKLTDDVKKDNVLTFEELGVDKLIVDEAHSFKNLYLFTKMRNVAGIGQTEALKSSDMFMKCRYLDEITNGKGIVFATGTPVSNSMSELYTMQRYLQYTGLKNYGHQNFDSWASTFGETTTAIELSPEGNGYRAKTRFSKFYNLPELMNQVKQFADIQTADMLNLPVPEVEYKKVLTKPTEEQKDILLSLGIRAEAVRDRQVEPTQDNMLKITNDGKKLALDQRLINELLPDDPNSKVNACIKNIYDIWEKSAINKSTQLVFCDMSTPKGDGSFNIYDDIRKKLMERGIPEKEIAFIHDANNEKQKDEMFAKVRSGEIRVLIGSTQKMGAGTNVQTKLIALHDLDVPWRPADLEQRAGRIVRQGNENKKVEVYRYVTENTFDAYLWQTIENKQKFISQIMTSKTPVRVAEDVDENALNYAEIKALATGNPLIKEKMDLDIEVNKLALLEANYKSNLYRLEDKILKFYPDAISETETKIQNIEKDLKIIEPLGPGENKFTSIKISGKTITDKKEAGMELLKKIQSVGAVDKKNEIAEYRGFKVSTYFSTYDNKYKLCLKGNAEYFAEFGADPGGNILRMDNLIEKIPEIKKDFENKLTTYQEELNNAKEEVVKPFQQAQILKEKKERLSELNRILNSDLQTKKEENLDESKEVLKSTKTYNCLTGEPINIENHSSGENKWIGKKDVERYGIEKIEGAKETIGQITYIENDKLYQKPVLYYNISDLKVTKDIEQKFVPMKEKEKTQEISKAKGQGIGD